jgi:hypothetical protein
MYKAIIVATAALLAAGNVRAATVIALSSGKQTANQFLSLDLGINFIVLKPVTVTALGAFTNGSSAIPVALYSDLDKVTPLLQMLVTGTPAQGSNYAFASVNPLVLAPGAYQINATYINSGNGNFNPYSSNPNSTTVSFNTLGGALALQPFIPGESSGSSYNYPSIYTTAYAATRDYPSPYGYGAGTFKATAAVPEPGSWALLMVGFGVIGIAARRKAAVPTSVVA